MQLSIIIPAFFGEDIFEECLESLYRSSEDLLGNGNWEILVYNNGFEPGRWQELQEVFPKIKFYGEGKNVGFSEGNNFLIEKCKGEYILLLNQDVFIKRKVVEKLIQFLEVNKEYSCVAPQLRFKSGEIQNSCRPFPTFGLFIKDIFTGGKSYRSFYFPDKDSEVDQPMASCLLYRKEVIDKLGGFDSNPHFFLFFNDVDLSYRTKNELGGKSYFLASVYAYHLHGSSTAILPEFKRLFLWWKGLGRFWYKTGDNYFWAYFKALIITKLNWLSKVGREIIK